jgi:integrase/recombinase XerD
MPGPEPRLHLPYRDWPVADRLLWERATDNDDPFADAPGARLSKASRQTYQLGWRRFLGFIATHEPTALELAPAERLTAERIRGFVTDLAATRSPTSVARLVDALYHAARVMMMERDWTWLRAIATRLRAAAPAQAGTRPIITSVQLLALGQQLMDESQPPLGSPISRADALRYRDGLIIAFLAFVPIRRKNLTALEIGRHLVREGDRWFVIIPREEAKMGTPIESPLPELLESYLAFYLDVVRQRLLCSPPCAALWVNSKGGRLSYLAIGRTIGGRSEDRLGVRITPHDARDAAATTWAVAAPDQIGVARDLLAHRDLRTTIKHYNRAKGVEASRAYRQVIDGMRGKQNHVRIHRRDGPGLTH